MVLFPQRGRVEERKNAVDNGSVFVVFIRGWVSAAIAVGGQIADQESEIRVLRSVTKRRSVMKLQRTFICIAGVFFAVGFAASQAGAGTGFPGCTDAEGNEMQIEINALRAGAKTVITGPNQTTDVTAKARLLKGTAVAGTTIVTAVTIEAVTPPGGTVISTNSQPGITLGVGKGGKGAKLSMAVTRCTSGFIEFNATFFGVDEDNDACMNTRTIRKACK
jgi:hypothetical protein